MIIKLIGFHFLNNIIFSQRNAVYLFLIISFVPANYKELVFLSLVVLESIYYLYLSKLNDKSFQGNLALLNGWVGSTAVTRVADYRDSYSDWQCVPTSTVTW